ncbi:MAG: hypothetical protein FWG10_09170 [Eubacteriaceae bacterium]|nr:hypothetical protein [Eubacteriaceae bacterium]
MSISKALQNGECLISTPSGNPCRVYPTLVSEPTEQISIIHHPLRITITLMEGLVMLSSIDLNLFAAAIKQSYKLMTDTSAANMATKLIQTLDPTLERAVIAWISGHDIPDITIGKYSITTILNIRNSCDYLDAFTLLSEYKLSPEKGEKRIWRPKQ